MENIETPKIKSFVEKYNEWLEARPKIDDLEYIHFSQLVILIGEDDDSLQARTVTNSDVHKVGLKDLIAIHQSIKDQLNNQTMKHIGKIAERKIDKTLI